MKVLAILIVALVSTGCGGHDPNSIAALSDEFVYTTLAFSPAAATSVGLHRYKGQNLDDMLDDVSNASLDRQRQFYDAFRGRLTGLNAQALTGEDRADLQILRDQTALALLDFDEIRSHRHNPTIYVELLGNAFFSPFILNYAPLEQRMRSIVARLEKVPLFLDQANTNLLTSPDIWTQVAEEENQGNIELVDRTIRAAVPADLKKSYDAAAAAALAAMRKFQSYLHNDLAERDYETGWRLGRDFYTRKFRYVLESGEDPSTVLEDATRDMEQVRARMLELALPLHRNMFPGHGEHDELKGAERENRVIGEVLSRIAERHSTPASYMDDARKDLAEARSFVAEKHLMTLPTQSNLEVIPTPEFMRGIYSVGGFNPAPPLEPQLGAYYWITPIPPDWPPDRVESKLREYNFYKLKLLTIHEAMPGHYVQMQISNGIRPDSRRVLRSVYGNGPYIEGWAQYAEQMMLDQGFMDHSPEMELTFLKERLRVDANAILDVRLQMLEMTDQQALDLMENQTFQEKEEATEKLRRAKLSSCQLPTYFVGWRGWLRTRDAWRQAKGSSYSLPGFNDRALRQGAVPLIVLGSLLE